MKKLYVFALLIFVGASYFLQNGGSANSFSKYSSSSEAHSAARNTNNYKCDGRQHCSQMTSYEEAKFFIENCPDTKMDGDHDGIPCERQFGH